MGRGQLQLAPILRHRPAGDVDMFRRQRLHELLIGEGHCGILGRDRTADSGRASMEALAPSSVAAPSRPSGRRLLGHRRRAD
jgi:hypothetical protein